MIIYDPVGLHWLTVTSDIVYRCRCRQWRRSGWNSGDAGTDPEGLVGRREVTWGGNNPPRITLPTGKGLGRGQAPLPKLYFSLEMTCFDESWTFCPCPHQKNVEFSAWSGDLVDVEDVLLGSIEYPVRVMGLVSFLLNCTSSNLVHEILKHDNIWEDNLHYAPNSGGPVPLPEIYVHRVAAGRYPNGETF